MYNYNIIEVYQEKCIGCSACIRVCPSPLANSIKTLEDGRTVTEIDSSKCIACGECVKACKSRARDYNDDTEKFFKDLKDRKIVVVAHPAIKTAFPGTWQAVLKWFKQNGADGVYDGAFGADICTWAYVRTIEQGNAKSVISPNCPSVVRYMEIYHPETVRELSPVHTPISCEAVYIRDYVRKNYAVAALTPCPSMKLEFEATGHAEYNITFKRLKEYFKRKKIDFNKSATEDQHYDFDDQMQGCMGGIFPLPGGLRYNLSINMPNIVAVNTDGADAVYRELDEYAETPVHRHPQVLDALSCSGGCGSGCGVHYGDTDQTSLDVKMIYREVEIDARNRRKTTMNGIDKQFKLFDERINPKSLIRNYDYSGKAPETPSIKELEDTFIQMGKEDDYSRKIDCKACGYNSCLQMAQAIYDGRNTVSGCVRCSSGAPAAAAPTGVSNKKTAEMAESVSKFATDLLADIENIYASLYSIENASQQSASMSGIVEDILAKVVGFCSSAEYIDSDNLPLLVSTLEKLQMAVSSLKNNVTECAAGSATIKEAMQDVADAANELNVKSTEMVQAISGR